MYVSFSAIWPACYSVSVQSKGGRPLAQRLRASSGGIHRTQFIGLDPLGLVHWIQTFGFNPLDAILGLKPLDAIHLGSMYWTQSIASIHWTQSNGPTPLA